MTSAKASANAPGTSDGRPLWHVLAAGGATAALAALLPVHLAALILAVGLPALLHVLGFLVPVVREPAEGLEPRADLERALNTARLGHSDAEARKRKAVEGSTGDRDQLYRLRGELVALSSTEDRVRFLTGAGSSSGATERAEERKRLWRETVAACRACEEERLEAEAAEQELTRLQARASALEAEIEATLQRRETEQASRISLDEETVKLRAQISRFNAKITAHDARLQHARQELNELTSSSKVEQRRLEAEIAADLHEKKREVRTEEQEAKRKQGEKRFVESVGQNLRRSLDARTREVEELQEKLERELNDRQSAEQSAESVHQEIARLKQECADSGIADQSESQSAPCGASDASPVADSTPSSKPKSKAAKKKKKNAEGPENKQLEDLEIERATVIAGKEAAEQRAKDARHSAEERFAKAKKNVELLKQDIAEISARLEMGSQERHKIESDRAKILAATEEERVKITTLEKEIKDMEREKIRLRIDIKRTTDSLKEKVETNQPANSSSEKPLVMESSAKATVSIESSTGADAAKEQASIAATSTAEPPDRTKA